MSQITQAVVADALDQQLASFGAGGGAINLEGSGYIPQAGQPYLTGRIATYERFTPSIGPDAVFAVSGTYQVRVNRPAAGGLEQGRAIAGRLVALFHRGTALALASGQSLTLELASEGPVISAGDWLSIPVTVAWYAIE